MRQTIGRTQNRPTEVAEIAFSWAWLQGASIVGIVVLLALSLGVVGLVGVLWSNGLQVALGAMAFGLGLSFLMYLISEPVVVWSTGAKRLAADHPFALLVADVAKNNAKMRCPRVYSIPERNKNACATGVYIPFLGGGALMATDGILGMDERKLRGVVGHELAHLKSLDLVFATMAMAMAVGIGILLQIIARAPGLLGSFRGGSKSSSSNSSSNKGGCLGGLIQLIIAAVIFAAVFILIFVVTQVAMPLVASWINRQRESLADQLSAMYIGSPDPLIDALNELESSNTEVAGAGHFVGMFFSMPAFGLESWVDRLYASHPAMHDRIKMLDRRADSQFNVL